VGGFKDEWENNEGKASGENPVGTRKTSSGGRGTVYTMAAH
jgi:hypothetical protein